MRQRNWNQENCSVARALGVLGDTWTLLILREAFFGTRRFADFEARLAISKNVLSQRLQHLVDHGVLEKIDVGRHGPRFEYRLTHMGKDLTTVLTALRQWGDRWILGEGNEPLIVVDRATGEPIEPVRIRRSDGSPIGPRELELRAGPGASEETRERLEAYLEKRSAKTDRRKG